MSIYVPSKDYHTNALIYGTGSYRYWLRKCIYIDNQGYRCLASPNLFCPAYTHSSMPAKTREAFQPSSARCHDNNLCLSNEGTLLVYFKEGNRDDVENTAWIAHANYKQQNATVTGVSGADVVDCGGWFCVSPIGFPSDDVRPFCRYFIRQPLVGFSNGTVTIHDANQNMQATVFIMHRPDFSGVTIPDDFAPASQQSTGGASYACHSLRMIFKAPTAWGSNFSAAFPCKSDVPSSSPVQDTILNVTLDTPTTYVKKVAEVGSETFWLLDAVCNSGVLHSGSTSYYHAWMPYLWVERPTCDGSVYIRDMHWTVRLYDTIKSNPT